MIFATGGAGDGDEAGEGNDEEKRVEEHLAGAKKRGKDVRELTSAVYLKWKKLGWYDAFYTKYVCVPLCSSCALTRLLRYGLSSAVVRQRVYHSGVLSDSDQDTGSAHELTDSDDQLKQNVDSDDGSLCEVISESTSLSVILRRVIDI